MPSVLIIDDEPNIRRMVGALLSAEGYEVRDAPDGVTGLSRAVESDPDVLLLDLMYSSVRRQNDQVTESFGESATVTTAEAQFDGPFRAPLHPNRSGRYYYNLTVEVQTLTETDLDALQQWLRGPTSPQKSNPVTAVSSGIGRLFSRMLGGGKQVIQERSGVFEVP